MINCQVIYLRTPRSGREIRREEAPLTADAITLGRESTCHVRLRDESVLPVHAAIRCSEDGRLLIEAEDGASIGLGGRTGRSFQLESGACLTIGATSVTVSEACGERLSLTVFEGGSPKSLADICLSEKEGRKDFSADKGSWRLGLALAGAILLVFLATLFTKSSSTFEAWQARQPLILTELLTPGSLSTAHSLFGARCSTCHRQAFVGVGDAACHDCHTAIGGHRKKAKPGGIPSQEPPCVACHVAHVGKAGVVDTKSAPCVDCHERLESRPGSIRDFGETHSPFRLTIFDGRKETSVREDVAAKPTEKPNLKFSHAIHLKDGGVSSPEGQTILECTSCHRPGDAGRGFAAPEMIAGCQQSGCHRIRFAEPMRGAVPHASVRELMNRMRTFFTNKLAIDPEEFRQQCSGKSPFGGTVRRILDCADQLARDAAARSLFRQTGDDLACALCHEITETGRGEVPWNILPVHWTANWHASADFLHNRHASMKCGDCHEKTASKNAADVSIPGIARCRECHTGSRKASGKLATGCADCHRFHRHASATPENPG